MALCRSREGAWIEIQSIIAALAFSAVAPARERGLKCRKSRSTIDRTAGRSREGAWIEIAAPERETCGI